MMTRRTLLALLGLQLPQLGRLPTGQQDSPEVICLGVVEGIPLEIECPDAGEPCSLGHRQKPLYVIELALGREGEERTLTIRVCRTCGVIYHRPEDEKEPAK